MVKKTEKKIVPKYKTNPFYILGKATEISFNMVFFPVLLLFFGLFIDKRLNTTPLFIIVGCITGLFFALFKAIKIKDQIYDAPKLNN